MRADRAGGQTEQPPPSDSKNKPRAVFWLRLIAGGVALGGVLITAAGADTIFSAQSGDGSFFAVLANLTAYIGIGIGGYIISRAFDV